MNLGPLENSVSVNDRQSLNLIYKVQPLRASGHRYVLQ